MDYKETKKYQKFLAARERIKKAKNKARAKKIAASRKENERKRNEESGLGYLTDSQIKGYKRHGENLKKEWLKNREKKRKEGYNAYLKRKHAEMKEREREKKREKKAAEKRREKEKAKEARKQARISAKKKARRIEWDRKRLLKHPIWIYAQNPYKVYVPANGHCMKNKCLGRYKTLDDARARVKELLDGEKDIYFERMSKTYEDGTMDVVYEYVIFKDVRDKEAESTYLKNEFGKYVEHNVKFNGKNYEIIEKRRAKVEDDVWVFGYDPRNDRKTFVWVYNNVLNEGFSSSHDIKRIYLYHNKVVFCNDKNEIDIIICKTARDAVRFYTTLQGYCKKGPYLFMGAVTTKSALCESLEKLLVEKTGWDTHKLRRNQHRF